VYRPVRTLPVLDTLIRIFFPRGVLFNPQKSFIKTLFNTGFYNRSPEDLEYLCDWRGSGLKGASYLLPHKIMRVICWGETKHVR